MDHKKLKKGNQFYGKEKYIKEVFTTIAEYYDNMNNIMSFGLIQRWHKFMMKKVGDISKKKCLDVGTGTGEIAFQIAKAAGVGSTVVGIDATPRMLEIASMKESKLNLPLKIDWRLGDALNLDFMDNSFDVVMSGYMLRNVTNIFQAISEMYRVLVPGGKVVVAELSKPKNNFILFLYNIYMNRVRKCGHKCDKSILIDGRQSAYDWLISSLDGFPYGDDMIKIFKEVGFNDMRFYVKSLGAVNIYVGSK